MRQLLIAMMLVLLGATAWAQSFPIEVKADFGALEGLEYSTYAAAPTAIVTVVNNEAQTVRCSATFKNGPETVRTKQAAIKAGEEGKLFFSAKRNIIKVRVELACAPDS